MRFLSTFSGIEAASLAWAPLGWQAAAFSEVDPFCCSLLRERFPDVPNLGDIKRCKEWPDLGPIDLLCGGSPCQSFSVAGLRKGLDDPRGNLLFSWLAVAARYRPRWLVYENVPGLLSQDDGRAFGSLLGALGELGYGFAYRVLDAQHFGIPQRRRRVVLVGHLGDWRRAAAVLFDSESLQGNPPPSRRSGQEIAGTVTGGARERGGTSTDDRPQVVSSIDASYGRLQGASGQDANHGHSHLIAGTLTSGGGTAASNRQRSGSARENPDLLVAFGGNDTRGPIPVATAVRAKGGTGHGDFESETFIVQAVQQSQSGTRMGSTSKTLDANNGSRRGADVLVFDPTQITNPDNRSQPQAGNVAHTLAKGQHAPAIAFDAKASMCQNATEELTGALRAMGGKKQNGGGQLGVLNKSGVRRLTPLECERLQGMPDDWTRVPGKIHRKRKLTKLRPRDRWVRVKGGWQLMAADGPRYKAIGNSWAVPVFRWVGERIAFVDSIPLSPEQP